MESTEPALPTGRSTHGINHLHLTEIALDELRIPERELRRHRPSQIGKLASSIERFGWITPLLIDQHGNVIAGIARIAAARKLGRTHAPAIRVEHLSEDEIRAYRIADNRLAEDAAWNNDALRLEISELIDLDFDIGALGFEVAEIDLLIGPEAGAEANIPEPPAQPVTRPGDIWHIGDHRLICADALDSDTYQHLLGSSVVDAVFTDAPYNVPVDAHVCGLGSIRHREFAMASGEMSQAEFSEFLLRIHGHLQTHLKQGGVLFSCMDWRSIETLMAAGRRADLELINLAVWDKGTGGMGSLYRSQHELICVFRKPGAPHRNNVELGRHGRNRTNVWTYPGCNGGGAQREALLALHPTVKPVALVEDALLDVTARGEIVLDVFGGSGTTMLAAQRIGRIARLVEIDPAYCDVILMRMQREYGLEVTHESGAGFADLESERRTKRPDDSGEEAGHAE